MNKVPHITIEQFTAMKNSWHGQSELDYINSRIDAYNKANANIDTQDQYITADDARALVESGGSAEFLNDFGEWCVCGVEHLNYETEYRAIRKEAPAMPHAELQSLYAQQVKDETLKDFVWEFFYLKTKKWLVIPVSEQPLFINPVQYRCTPKPTCQILNTDTGKLKTMTREAARNLQYETKDTHDWFIPDKNNYGSEALEFNASGIYTFNIKANLVKLDGIDMTKEAAAEIVKNSPDKELIAMSRDGEVRVKPEFLRDSGIREYQLRSKPAKAVAWTGSRDDVIALLKELGV